MSSFLALTEMKSEDNEDEDAIGDFIVSPAPEEQNGVSLRAATLEKLVEFCAREFGKFVSFANNFRAEIVPTEVVLNPESKIERLLTNTALLRLLSSLFDFSRVSCIFAVVVFALSQHSAVCVWNHAILESFHFV